MRLTEFSLELEKYQIFCRSLSESSFAMDLSKKCGEIPEITKIKLYMTRSFCVRILYPWTDSLHDIMLDEKLSILIDLSSRDIEEFCYLIRLKEISYIHRYSADIDIEYTILFFEQFLY